MKAWMTIAVLALAGCGQVDTNSEQSVGAVSFAGERTLAQVDMPVQVSNRVGLAQATDMGRLTNYPKQAPVRDGAYTWHRVNLSEQHALNAIASGNLHLTTPAGEALNFAYERHVEHPNGDWTFVGRLRNGQPQDEVVLTFGQTAVFGTIAQGAGRPALRMMMRDRQSWMVETDPRQLGQYQSKMTPEGSTDAVIPEVQQVEAQIPVATHKGPRMAAAQATSTEAPVLDLLIGYTTGYAKAMGGDDIAKTRLFYLVELTNQAYANSQVGGRVRLVHLMKVDYVDATSNDTTLQVLGGVASTKNAELDALRAARDTYGADLVSLVRKFEMNNQGGCGIGWLLGGGQQPYLQATGAYAFSVVSDGPFIDSSGRTVWCRDDALAHEIGHNLGAHHDRATATHGDGTVEYGAFPYSFGHKTDLTTGNFYTVMTYNNSDQVAYRTFSNPRTTFCGGRACGVENQSDNARTIATTMPIAAGFREQVVSDTDLPTAPPPPPTTPPPPTPPATNPPHTGPTLSDCPPPEVYQAPAVDPGY